MTNKESPQKQTDMQAVILADILVIVHGTKPIFKHGREFDESDLI